MILNKLIPLASSKHIECVRTFFFARLIITGIIPFSAFRFYYAFNLVDFLYLFSVSQRTIATLSVAMPQTELTIWKEIIVVVDE